MIRDFHLYLYGPETGPLSTSFEAAAERLNRIDQLVFEPDGSFVWSPSEQEKLFGMVYDAADRVQYVELRGACCRETWTELVRVIGQEQLGDMMVMCLQDRELKKLHSFEDSVWKSD